MLVVLTSLGLAACARGVPVEQTGTGGTTPPRTATAEPTTTANPSTSGPTAPTTPTSPGEPPSASIPDNLRIGISFTNPGIGLETSEGHTGLDADVARFVAGRLGASRVTFVEAIPNQRVTLLETKQVDLVIASYSMDPTRAQRATFAGPYLSTGQDLLVSARSKIRTPKQLRGFTVCSAEGTASTEELVDDYPGLHLVERPTVAECVALLKEGEVKAVTSDAAILAGFARTSRSPDRLVLARRPFTRERWGIAVRHNDTAMCREVSRALRQMIRSGEWKRAVRDNLPGSAILGEETLTKPTVAPCAKPTSTSTTTSGSPSSS